MSQIPDEAAERVLGTIRGAIDLDAQDPESGGLSNSEATGRRIRWGLDAAQLHGMDLVALRAAPRGDRAWARGGQAVAGIRDVVHHAFPGALECGRTRRG